jgi:hypothetical protein
VIELIQSNSLINSHKWTKFIAFNDFEYQSHFVWFVCIGRHEIKAPIEAQEAATFEAAAAECGQIDGKVEAARCPPAYASRAVDIVPQCCPKTNQILDLFHAQRDTRALVCHFLRCANFKVISNARNNFLLKNSLLIFLFYYFKIV